MLVPLLFVLTFPNKLACSSQGILYSPEIGIFLMRDKNLIHLNERGDLHFMLLKKKVPCGYLERMELLSYNTNIVIWKIKSKMLVYSLLDL